MDDDDHRRATTAAYIVIGALCMGFGVIVGVLLRGWWGW